MITVEKIDDTNYKVTVESNTKTTHEVTVSPSYYKKLTGEKISPEKLNEMYKWLNSQVFSLSSIFSRVVMNKGLLKSPLTHLLALAVNLRYRMYTKRGDAPNVF